MKIKELLRKIVDSNRGTERNCLLSRVLLMTLLKVFNPLDLMYDGNLVLSFEINSFRQV